MPECWGIMPWYGMIFGPIMMIVVLTSIVVAVVLISRWLGFRPGSGNGVYSSPRERKETAIEILEARFAKGEIEKEEFEEKRRLLSR